VYIANLVTVDQVTYFLVFDQGSLVGLYCAHHWGCCIIWLASVLSASIDHSQHLTVNLLLPAGLIISREHNATLGTRHVLHLNRRTTEITNNEQTCAKFIRNELTADFSW